MPWKDEREHPNQTLAWEDRLTWFKSSPEYTAFDRIDGEPMEFEWNIFPGFTTLQLVREFQELLSRLSVQPAKFTGRTIFMSIFKIPKSECPDIWIRLPRHKWPKSWSSMEDPVVPLERNLYGHPLAGPLWERQFEKILLKHGWEKIPNWECLFVHREKGLFLSVYVDDIKLAGKKQNLDPMWKVLNKEVDLGEPTSFLDHVYLGCTQRQCEISKDIVDNYRTMFESRISAGGVEKLPFPQNLRISSWSYDMAGHAKKCVERYCELANKTTQQLFKVSTPCIDDHHFKEEEMKSVGELSKVCSQIVLKCLYLARIGRPDILWSVNNFARSITKWT